MKKQNTFWFKRKVYGWGWFPVTWQGWLVVSGYVVAMVVGSWLILKDAPEDELGIEFAGFLALSSVLSLGLILIASRKGPKPKWQWGEKDDKK